MHVKMGYHALSTAFTASVPLNATSRSLPRDHFRMCAQTPPKGRTEELYVDPAPRAGRVVLSTRGTWTNPTRQLLTPICERLHCIERSYIWLDTFDVGGRCTLIETADGLVIFSPLALTTALLRAIDRLGPVKLVIAPNNEHVDFVLSFATAYPDAIVLGPPNCRSKWPQLPFSGDTFDDQGTPHPALAAFAPDIVPIFVPSAPFFNETILFHVPSQTLMVCDLWWNFPSNSSPPAIEVTNATKVFGFLMNRAFLPVYNRVLVKDRTRFRRFFAQLRQLGVERLVPTHGFIVQKNCMQTLEQFFPDYLKPAQ